MTNDIAFISPPGTPAGGHYSPAVVHNGLVYVSGQLPLVPGAVERKVGPIEEQTRQALQNVIAVVVAAGSRKERILSMTLYVSDLSLWSAVNAVYTDVMGEHRPARAVVPTGMLHFGYYIEIQAIAAL